MASAPVPQKPLLICLMGPTASGKTDLAIALSKHLDCELVSVDSALVYRGLDIGSAKPEFPHHLVDVRDPGEAYSAAEFVQDATRLVGEIAARGRVPLLVGGTMLYFKAFLEGLAEMPAADPQIRSEIEAQAEAQGWPAIHARLQAVDPESAERIHPNHSQRLSRALEVFLASGVPLSEWHRQGHSGNAQQAFLSGFDVRQLAICPADRSVLHSRIEKRFDMMMSQGFLDEVRRLHARGDLTAELPAVRAVGYRQLWQHLEGELSLDDAVQNGVAATRQLAKRQLTWLRKWRDIEWILTDKVGNVVETAGGSAFVGEPPERLALNYLAIPPT